ncbi:hypothetical protein GGR50DRAFT_646681 [Xylaria sp. CBS 124048]|nr:hypothetical protein GGR50DRAFT_646681 [Xylaria sp. CBS 124048]
MSQIAALPIAGAAATAAATATTASASALTGSEQGDIREYEKIVQFRDTVVSGKHPRIKVPASSVAKNASTSTPASQQPLSGAPGVASSTAQQAIKTTNEGVNGHSTGNLLSFKANSQQSAVTMPPASSASFIPGVSKPFGSGKPEINPVLLQKSDDLIKAEIQMQRQRLEKALRDQQDQRKNCMKSSLQSEQASELDISDTLAKALTLVQATAPPPTSVFPSPTANASNASDSFDENTFYSSQPGTPGSQPALPPRNTVGDIQLKEASAATYPTASSASISQALPARPLPTPTSRQLQTDVTRNIPQVQIVGTQGTRGAQNALLPAGVTAPLQNQGMVTSAADNSNLLNQGYWRGQLGPRVISSDSRDASRSDNSGNTDTDLSADQRRLQNSAQLVSNPNSRQPQEPLIRGHNLSPFAPQPAHVSPLALARQPHLRDSDATALRGAPAQITALRQDDTVVISPESSPQGDRSKKKNKKKNKRKADARAQDTRGSPYIKPEPRSPSPVSAPSFMPPQKRARRSTGRPELDPIYNDTHLERPSPQLRHERYPPAPMRVEPMPLGYERVDDPYSRPLRSSVAPVTRRLHSPLYEERRPDGSIVRYVQRIPSPPGYPNPYDAVDTRPSRAVSYAVANPELRDVPTYQRERRMSVRPYSDRARSRSPVMMETRQSVMPPPSAPPHRILVDEYGRDYHEPTHTTMSRRSVVPSTRTGDHEVTYERAPVRATSHMPAQEIVGEDGAIYRRVSPGYAPRRIIAEPDYSTGFRSYRERDYPVQPMGPPSQEFVQMRGAMENRVTEHVPREFIPRAASVRPVGPVESITYDRLPSARIDGPPRRYAASVRPEARREAAPHLVREYSERPIEMEMPPRAYSVRPVERYYEPPREGDVTYVERPRVLHQEVIYPENGTPRQMYQ